MAPYGEAVQALRSDSHLHLKHQEDKRSPYWVREVTDHTVVRAENHWGRSGEVENVKFLELVGMWKPIPSLRRSNSVFSSWKSWRDQTSSTGKLLTLRDRVLTCVCTVWYCIWEETTAAGHQDCSVDHWLPIPLRRPTRAGSSIGQKISTMTPPTQDRLYSLNSPLAGSESPQYTPTDWRRASSLLQICRNHDNHPLFPPLLTHTHTQTHTKTPIPNRR